MNENEVSSPLADHHVVPQSDLVTQDPDDPFERVPDELRVDQHEGLAGQLCLKSRLHFEVGDVLATFSAKRYSQSPHRMTVQVGASSHIELAPLCIELINHSCDPNVFFDVRRFEIVALKAIAPDDELTFFYPSTEWRMESPFSCECGTARCLGRIDGASRLGRAKLSGYRLSAHIDALLEQHDEEACALDLGLFEPDFAL